MDVRKFTSFKINGRIVLGTPSLKTANGPHNLFKGPGFVSWFFQLFNFSLINFSIPSFFSFSFIYPLSARSISFNPTSTLSSPSESNLIIKADISKQVVWRSNSDVMRSKVWIFIFSFHNDFERGSANHNQEPELSVSLNVFLCRSKRPQTKCGLTKQRVWLKGMLLLNCRSKMCNTHWTKLGIL